MKKTTYKIIFTFLFTFVFILNVNAECSYKERKSLLDEAKNVDIGYEIITNERTVEGVNPDSGEDMVTTVEDYEYKFYITNLTDNIYIRYYNLFDNEEKYIMSNELSDGIYYFSDNNYLDLYKYIFEIRSNNNNCLGEVMYTKKITKPVYNIFSSFSICSKDGMENYKYCSKFITKQFNISESEFIKFANEYYDSLQNKESSQEDKKVIEIIKKYWYIIAISVAIVFVVIISIVVVKKRSEL